MVKIYTAPSGASLYVGDGFDFVRANEKEMKIISACKEGPHGHRSILNYKTLGAPKGTHYLFVRDGNHSALNLIDPDDPNLIPNDLITGVLELIHKYLNDGKDILLHCNHGVSRSPSIALLYLRYINEVPESLKSGLKVFHSLYPKYKPNMGMKAYVRQKYKQITPVE